MEDEDVILVVVEPKAGKTDPEPEYLENVDVNDYLPQLKTNKKVHVSSSSGTDAKSEVIEYLNSKDDNGGYKPNILTKKSAKKSIANTRKRIIGDKSETFRVNKICEINPESKKNETPEVAEYLNSNNEDDEGCIPNNPTKKLKSPKIPNKRKRFILGKDINSELKTDETSEVAEYLNSNNEDDDDDEGYKAKKSTKKLKSPNRQKRFIVDKNKTFRVNEICKNNPELKTDETSEVAEYLNSNNEDDDDEEGYKAKKSTKKLKSPNRQKRFIGHKDKTFKANEMCQINDDLNKELAELINSNNDDDIDDDDYKPSKSTKKLKNKKKTIPNRQNKYVGVIKDYTSRVDEILQLNPELKKDDTALITFIVQEMQNLEVPPLGPDCYDTLPGNIFHCNDCKITRSSKGDIERHWQEYHGPRYLFCMACGADFRSKTNLFRHEKKCKAPKAGYVRKARAVYVTNQSKGRRKDHPNIDVPRKNHRCDICHANFSIKSSLVCHKKKHEPSNLTLPEHVRIMHSIGRKFICRICAKAYRSASSLYKHKWKHLNEKFICDHCGCTCTNKVTFIQHLKLHTPRYECTRCPLKFGYKAALKFHVQREHLGLPPPYLCTICSKRFCHDRNLKHHMKTIHNIVVITRQMLIKSLTKKQIENAMFMNKVEMLKSHITEMHGVGNDPDDFKIETVPIEFGNTDNQDNKNDIVKMIVLDDGGVNNLTKIIEDYDKKTDKSNIIVVQDGKILDLNEEMSEYVEESFLFVDKKQDKTVS